MNPQNLTHAGGIVRRIEGGAVHVLLVSARRTSDWVLPKGHLEPGESPEQTAVREVREEAGVEAAVVRYLDVLTFRSPRNEAVRVAYYLMAFVREVPPMERRQIRWCPVAEALEAVRFENTRALLRSIDSVGC